MEVTIKYINACDLKVGDQLSESDGFLSEVTEIIKETEKLHLGRFFKCLVIKL